jgi:glycosyltransferase involved in cell wall biosynthesis/mannose-6-phosphate isomerase-like protein (cupin superfamily)/tetratricopeptide (TPR) repeat protein
VTPPQLAAIAADPTENVQEGQASAFARDGFLGPVRLFSALQSRLIASHLQGADEPRPADWQKGRAVTDRFFYELAAHPALLSQLRPLLGDNIVLWGAGVVRRKPGQVHTWHTDIESSGPDGRFVSAWIGIENTTRESSLQLIARSHSVGKCLQQVAQERGSARGEASVETMLAWARELDPNVQFLQPDVHDGEALLFDGRLWHGSNNTQRQGRVALLLQYASADTPVYIPDFKHRGWPFRFFEEPRPPVILVSGTADEGVNRLVPPPAPNPKLRSVLGSGVHPLPLPLRENLEKGWRSHHVFRGCSPALDFMGCHVSILHPDRSPHPPHAHGEEEVLIVLDGEAELIISDSPEIQGARRDKIGPGSFAYYPPYQHHTIHNPGSTPVTYLMFKWLGDAPRVRRRLATGLFHYGDRIPNRQKPIWGARILHDPTACLETLSSHVTVLQPGAGYEPHVDPYDVAILLLSGTVRTLDQTISSPGVVYYPAGEPHGMRNIGREPARYLVFEFHPSERRAWNVAFRGDSIRAAVGQLTQRVLGAGDFTRRRRRLADRARKRFARTRKRLKRAATRLARLPRRGVVGGKQLARRQMDTLRRILPRHGPAGSARRLAVRVIRTVLRRPSSDAKLRRRRQADKRKRRNALRRGRKLDRGGDFAGALAAYERVPLRFRDNARILEKRAGTLARLGQLNFAYDVALQAVAANPARKAAWTRAARLLSRLDRSEELPGLLDRMLAALPHTSSILMKAASIARKGRLQALADGLVEQAVSHPIDLSPTETLRAGRALLRQGAQGRLINLLDQKPIRSDPSLRSKADDLRGLAFAQLRVAGANFTGSVANDDRADVIAVRSILQQDELLDGTSAPRRGIAIVMSTLGPGGIERQIVRLVRQLCRQPIGPITLLLLSRSRLAPEFNMRRLAGFDVAVERIQDFDIDLRELVPARLAGRLTVLPPKITNRTSFLIDRLRVHRPEAVLAMGENPGLPAMLAASITGVPRVVVSGRGEPPPARGLSDKLLKPAYQAALALGRVSFVTISTATARDYAGWLDQPADRVGVIYNGVDIEELRSERNDAATAAHRRSLGIPDGARVVGSIFNARPEKGRQLWIQAAALIAKRAPDVFFVLVGGRHSRNDVSTTLSQLGLDGRFHRAGVQPDAATWLDLMDVVLLTSRSDATPNVLLEAQALGRPVVATAVGGNAETFLPGQTGILLSADPTAEEVADAVIRILEDPSAATKARERAPIFIRDRFGEERMAREYLELCLGATKADSPPVVAAK